MSSDRDARWHQDAREFVVLWWGLFRGIGLYERENAVVRVFTERVRQGLQRVAEGGPEVEVSCRYGSLYVSGERIRAASGLAAAYDRVVEALGAARVASFSVETDASHADIETFARALMATAEGRLSPPQLERELRVHGCTSIETKLVSDEELSARPVDAAQVAKRLYLRSMGVLKSVFAELRSDQRITARRVKRVVQQMIDSLDRDPSLLLSLASLKSYDEYTFNHSVNVSVLAIALGRHVGLSRRQLFVIGQVGMFHDVGKLFVPRELLNKPGRLTAEERATVETHAVHGFITNAGKLGVTPETVEIALGAYEHHKNLDGTGYPPRPQAGRPGLLSRIVAIVDRYDAMTSPRVYRPQGIPAPKALALLLHANNALDQVLVRAFLNLTGHYPLGTAVRLTDGCLGMVVGGSADPHLRHLPQVKVLFDASGRGIPARVLDLARDPSGPRVREVVRATDLHLDPLEYM